MATESSKSTRPGDAKYKPSNVGSFGSDKTVGILNGGTGNGSVKGGKTNDGLKKLGRSMEQAAADGKAY